VFAEGTNLGIVGGSANPDGARSGFLGGVRVSVSLGRWFVAEGELAGLATEDRLHQRKARVLGYRLSGVAPLTAGAFRPFVMVGAGAMQVVQSDAEGGAGLALDTKAEVHTGIGFDYRVMDNVSIRGDARVMQVPSKQSWGLTSDVEAMVGAMVGLGRGHTTRPLPASQEEPTQRASSDVVPAVAVAEPASLAQVPAEVDQVTQSQGELEALAASPRTLGDLLDRGREIRFEPGTVKLLETSLPFLDELAAALVKEPTARLEIVAHTADTGDAKKDLTLSKRRADVIKRVLVDKGANAEQLLATGRGSEDPVAPNLTRTGRYRNERVELHRASSPARGS
jgi:outer membrane protein OmpA-like peptidoglycan-associated protein